MLSDWSGIFKGFLVISFPTIAMPEAAYDLNVLSSIFTNGIVDPPRKNRPTDEQLYLLTKLICFFLIF